MKDRVILNITMELKSDAIFGSGFSVPGGEDIAVCTDNEGYPYMKGSTFKGILRESMENILAWTGASEWKADALLGVGDWAGAADERRIHFTEFILSEEQKKQFSAEKCIGERTFTSLKNGMVEEGTLRTAACVCRGLKFVGELTCIEKDVPLLTDALRGIKWVGTMRSRGFGRVDITAKVFVQEQTTPTLPKVDCVRYRIRTVTPVLVTDLSRSHGNGYETRGYLPGAAIRGMVMSTLAAENQKEFEQHKLELLSEQTRFTDALPVVEKYIPLPTIKGFYEDKQEQHFWNVVIDEAFKLGSKRAKLGAFCALEGDTIHNWSAKTGGVMRIRRSVQSGQGDDKNVFQTRHLEAGQVFEGYIMAENRLLMPIVGACLHTPLWLGADRYAGFGKCELVEWEPVEQTRPQASYGCKEAELSQTLYLLALSPFTMMDECGNPCGLDTAALAEKLGVASVSVERCSTAIAEYSGYNRVWQCQAPTERMYDRGSIFKLQCRDVPTLSAVRAVEQSGLGIRRSEGYGQVLFLSRQPFENISKKQAVVQHTPAETGAGAAIRRAKYLWIMEQETKLQMDSRSKSQLGTIQALCETAISRGGDCTELETFFAKKKQQGVKNSSRFTCINGLIDKVMKPQTDFLQLMQSLKAAHDDVYQALQRIQPLPELTAVERLELLCMLFNYSRKGRKEAD